MVERQLPKLNVAGSNLVSRSIRGIICEKMQPDDGAAGINLVGRDDASGAKAKSNDGMIPPSSCSSVVEHSLGKGEVDSSILSTSSKYGVNRVGQPA